MEGQLTQAWIYIYDRQYKLQKIEFLFYFSYIYIYIVVTAIFSLSTIYILVELAMANPSIRRTWVTLANLGFARLAMACSKLEEDHHVLDRSINFVESAVCQLQVGFRKTIDQTYSYNRKVVFV